MIRFDYSCTTLSSVPYSPIILKSVHPSPIAMIAMLLQLVLLVSIIFGV